VVTFRETGRPPTEHDDSRRGPISGFTLEIRVADTEAKGMVGSDKNIFPVIRIQRDPDSKRYIIKNKPLHVKSKKSRKAESQ
jgi:hypothetical protein